MNNWNQKLPPYNRHLGINIAEWRDGYVVLEAQVLPEYCNNSGIAHGGFISSLIDMATGHSGIYCDERDRVRKALTLSLNINFIGQAAGDKLTVVGEVTGGGRKIFYSKAEVFDETNTLIASGQAVCRYRTGSES